MTWVGMLTLPGACITLLAWLFCLSTERWLQGWVLGYVAQGIAGIACVLYLCTGDRGTALAPLGLVAALVFTRWFLGPDGPRRLRRRAPRESRRARARGGPDSFRAMWTTWAWLVNPVLALLLWAAWTMILAGLGLILVTVA
jgi:hypothetical protein